MYPTDSPYKDNYQKHNDADWEDYEDEDYIPKEKSKKRQKLTTSESVSQEAYKFSSNKDSPPDKIKGTFDIVTSQETVEI